MNRVQPIYDITVQIQSLLEGTIASQDRQQVVEEIDTLLIKRGTLMEKVTEPYSPEELALGKELLSMNQSIQQKMSSLFVAIKGEMKQIKKQKHSNRKYTNPYENVQTMDGMFMDKKK